MKKNDGKDVNGNEGSKPVESLQSQPKKKDDPMVKLTNLETITQGKASANGRHDLNGGTKGGNKGGKDKASTSTMVSNLGPKDCDMDVVGSVHCVEQPAL